MKQRSWNLKTIAFVAMLGAVSAVLMTISIPLPFAPTFLRFDISELPALFAGFFLGPVSGCAVIVVKNLLKLILQGTETAYVGELMNIVGSICFMLPAALLYKVNHTKRGALISLVSACAIACVAAHLLNVYVAFPMYASLYGMPMQAIVEMGSVVNPLVHDSFTLMFFGVLPFNIIKHGVTALVTYLVYKRCGSALRKLLNAGRVAAAA